MVSELSTLVSYGDHMTPLEQMSRGQLSRYATLNHIDCPPDATKEQLLQIIGMSGVDPTQAEHPIKLKVISGDDEYGRPSQYLAPDLEQNQSARENVDSNSILQRRLDESETKNDAQAMLIGEQAEKIDRLEAMVERLMTKLDEHEKPPSKTPKGTGLKHFHALKRRAKELGLDAPATAKIGDLEQMIAEAEDDHTADRGQ